MIAECEKKKIYIIISQTGTVLSRILRLITGADYNHVSLGLSEELDNMYSFGRLNPYNPFFGGFVVESRHYGTFKRFKNTDVIVLSLEVGEEKKNQITNLVEGMVLHPKKYHYNYFGLVLAAIKVTVKRNNYYYCSEFVRDVLREFDIEGSHEMEKIVKPIHFLDIPYTNIIYKGKLCNYSIEK